MTQRLPRPGLPLGQSDTPNPLKVKDLMRLAGSPGRDVRGQLTARTSAGVTRMPSVDFTLHYEIQYRDLPN